MRIVFIGTPDFAAISLRAMLAAGPTSGFEVVGVVTATDKPAHRGHAMTFSAVKEVALEHNLPLLQPEKLKDPIFLDQLRAWKADLQVIVAFRMLPEVVWNMPPMGSLNLHASALPYYRGAAPINWALMNGETETGLTTFLLQHKIDTGHILLSSKVTILPNENFGELYTRMAHLGSELLVATLQGLVQGNIVCHPQPEVANAPLAPKIHSDTCQLDLNKPAAELVNWVRGLSPSPCAFLLWNGEKLKIYEASAEERLESKLTVGQIMVLKDQLLIGTSQGALAPQVLQFPGKKRLPVADAIRGLREVPEFVG